MDEALSSASKLADIQRVFNDRTKTQGSCLRGDDGTGF
jgi:hypothetical protein